MTASLPVVLDLPAVNFSGGKGRAPQTAVAGVTGYTGAELARLLLHHPRLQGCAPIFLGRETGSDVGEGSAVRLVDLHPQLAGSEAANSATLQPFSWESLLDQGVEILFLATPHEQSRAWVPQALAHGMRVIDLSGAWRLHDCVNRAVYRFADHDQDLAQATQSEAVYGLPELHREQIASARLVANPGCYATSVILALAPFVLTGMLDLDRGIIADSKSGVSGAGKAPTAATHFMHAADNFSAYSVFGHRHTGELLEQLHLTTEQIVFTPHLLPIPRGILSTIYVRLQEPHTADGIEDILRDFYSASPMVRIHNAGKLPEIQHSVRTCYSDIGFALAPDGRRLVIVSCLDNLLKGASGQAVQNMNLMLGWKESEGLL